MALGTVERYDAEKGFGFIEQERGGPELYVRRSEILGSGIPHLDEGQRVVFEIGQGPKGIEVRAV
ncbi:cold-shock protein [Streptomyces griseoincarnatus]